MFEPSFKSRVSQESLEEFGKLIDYKNRKLTEEKCRKYSIISDDMTSANSKNYYLNKISFGASGDSKIKKVSKFNGITNKEIAYQNNYNNQRENEDDIMINLKLNEFDSCLETTTKFSSVSPLIQKKPTEIPKEPQTLMEYWSSEKRIRPENPFLKKLRLSIMITDDSCKKKGSEKFEKFMKSPKLERYDLKDYRSFENERENENNFNLSNSNFDSPLKNNKLLLKKMEKRHIDEDYLLRKKLNFEESVSVNSVKCENSEDSEEF